MKSLKRKNPRDKFTHIHCIVCSTKITMLKLNGKEFDVNDDKFDPLHEMVNGGTITEISFGYGSKHDGDIFYMGICDKCTTEKFQNGTLRYQKNAFGIEYTEEEIKSSDKQRNRRDNLNDLIK